FDVYYDPEDGHYQNPRGLEIMEDAGFTPLPYDPNNDLAKSGLKMFHTQDVDFRSHHLLFLDGLRELQIWSQENPNHTPISVLINAKDASIPLTDNPEPFDEIGMKLIDDEIRMVFEANQLITPDVVRQGLESLESAVLTVGWPKLSESLGKVLFVLDEGQTKTNLYLSSFPKLNGAALFVNVEEGNPESGFRIINDPIGGMSEIQRLVGLGYMVRTRADSETIEARANDRSRFEAAISSGAQVISTDYYIPSKLFDSPFQVVFDDGRYERIK
ncbi:MAG: hypothetical protein HRT61_04620, partial [Ekhidna sp.]|nr:hypothetical protein [Ekhidna sp.]